METEESAPISDPKPSRAPWVVAGAAMAVALVAVVVAVTALVRDDTPRFGVAAAMERADFIRPISGEIASIDGTSFKVKERFPNGERATTSVFTDRDTRFHEWAQGAVSDLVVGDVIVVSGTTADDAVTATRITETAAEGHVVKAQRRAPMIGGGPMAPPGAEREVRRAGSGNRLAGEIASIEGDTITLSSFEGATVVVKTTAQTRVRSNDEITMSSLHRGDVVRVVASKQDGRLVAHEVTLGELADKDS
ncbi:MAG TPA: DUF5666 domain-containing protein [Acidimicrobiales bacterium]|nr:DUF5666 domain-containing protein [Acidimicrobiales bacterium]